MDGMKVQRVKKITGHWYLEVCKTCHRRAIWPFCEHREMNNDWLVIVSVSGKIEPKPEV